MPGVREAMASALFVKGTLLERQGRTAEAISAFDEIIRRYDRDTSPDMRKTIVEVRENRARLSQ